MFQEWLIYHVCATSLTKMIWAMMINKIIDLDAKRLHFINVTFD